MKNEVRANGYEYDEERYDPDDPDHCQKCGAKLRGYGPPSPCVHCPECEVLVVTF